MDTLAVVELLLYMRIGRPPVQKMCWPDLTEEIDYIDPNKLGNLG